MRLQLWQGALDSLSAQVAILDARGEIVAVNAAWRRLCGSDNGQIDPDRCVGADYLSGCEHEDAAGPWGGLRAAQAIRDVLSGRRREVAFAYAGPGRGKKRWMLFRATRFEGPEPGRIVVAHENISTPKAPKPRKARAGGGEALEADGNRIVGLIGANAALEAILHGVALLVESQRPDTCCAVVLLRNGRAEVAAAPNFSRGAAGTGGKGGLGVDRMRHHAAFFARSGPGGGIEPGDNVFRFVPIETQPGEIGGSLVTASPAGYPAPDTAILERAAALVALALERAGTHERLSFQAQHDSLTRASEPAPVPGPAAKTLFRNRREGEPFAVLVLGLDRFQQVNDDYGYVWGDVLLREAAQRIVGCVRPDDTVARLGGDEFIAILASVGRHEEIERIGRRIVEAFHTPFPIGKQSIRLTCSVGISLYPQDSTEPGTLVRYASEALSDAKRSGKNRWTRYGPRREHEPQPGGAQPEGVRRWSPISRKAAAIRARLDLEYQAAQVDRLRRVVKAGSADAVE